MISNANAYISNKMMNNVSKTSDIINFTPTHLMAKNHYTKLYSAIAVALCCIGVSISHTANAAQTNNTNEITYSAQALSSDGSIDGIVAIANDTPILKSELTSAMQQARMSLTAMGEQVPADDELRRDVLNSLIMRSLQMDMIQRAGIRPNPDVVNQRLLQIAQSQGINSLSQLQMSLDNSRPGSYAQLREHIIIEEALKSLQQSQITKRVNISESDIDAFLSSPEAKRLEQSEYRTIHIRVPYTTNYANITEEEKQQAIAIANEVRSKLTITNDVNLTLDEVSQSAVAKDYPIEIQGGDMGYHHASSLPTEIANRITNLQAGDVSDLLITPQGVEVVKLVDKRSINENMQVEQWHVRHILIKSDENITDELAEQEIINIYNQLQNGADFELLASTYSDDPGTAGRGGDLEWVSEGEMVDEFEAMMKNTAVGKYSAPFKTQFGWHVLQVVEKRDRDLSEDYRRNMAAELLYQRLAPQAQEDWLQELRSNAYVVVYD